MNIFEDLKLSNELQTAIKRLGFEKPTQIQDKSIPFIVHGKDVVGESATGSGKTLAFGCGIFEHVVPSRGLQALILTPTRELAEQVKNALGKLSRQLRIISVYGGVSIGPQIDDLVKADVVVATPGRLLDHLQRQTIDVSRIKLLVLDEADRMFDMGFINDVEKIIRVCPRDRQTLCFSATISSTVMNLAHKFMNNPVRVNAVKHVDPSKLKQVYYDVPKNLKLALLIHLLQNEKSELVMVFCNTRRNTDFIVKNLKANGVRAIAIHGGLSQNKRTRTINTFDEGKISVLVCTDVASRGLDIDDISHIYNYDIPKDSKDYVHRIGRTARAGEEGKVINVLSDVDHDNFSRILRDYSFNIEKSERPYLQKVIIKKDFSRKRKYFRRGNQYNRRRFHRR